MLCFKCHQDIRVANEQAKIQRLTERTFEKIRQGYDQSIAHWKLLLQMKITSKTLRSIIDTLASEGKIRAIEQKAPMGRPSITYQAL